ncbi:MAG: hypothetical protein AAF307_10340 [Pseudomonadota bacterium]
MTEQHSLETDHILIAAAIAQQHGFYEMRNALHFLAKTTVYLEQDWFEMSVPRGASDAVAQ